MTYNYEESKAYQKAAKSASLIELRDRIIANRSWFIMEYTEKKGVFRVESQFAEAYENIELDQTLGSSKYHNIDQFDTYSANVDRMIKSAKIKKPRKARNYAIKSLEEEVASLKNDYQELARLYSSLCGKMGGYQTSVTKLSNRMTAIEGGKATDAAKRASFW